MSTLYERNNPEWFRRAIEFMEEGYPASHFWNDDHRAYIAGILGAFGQASAREQMQKDAKIAACFDSEVGDQIRIAWEREAGTPQEKKS